MIQIMARKNYSDEFRRQAVDLYESTAGATVRSVAEELGVERGTLRHWLDLHGTGRKTAADGSASLSPLKRSTGSSPGGKAVGAAAEAGESPQQRIDRLEGRVQQLEAETLKLRTEREILRQAAKYFAGETRW